MNEKNPKDNPQYGRERMYRREKLQREYRFTKHSLREPVKNFAKNNLDISVDVICEKKLPNGQF